MGAWICDNSQMKGVAIFWGTENSHKTKFFHSDTPQNKQSSENSKIAQYPQLILSRVFTDSSSF